ncbi:variable surface protein [Plasmodium gonderi]|uniref:Variable surface protein n=1 Tax=Plasmodium gonderi TaxID=77519 RepID=A0A1Y1JT73_PLAGO|nr:variable surface protein [Plasmodium gonderi]GAW84638.1 variable surface protein [Plasmodium gonderi]
MAKSIYDVLKNFPECKNKVDEYSTDWISGLGGPWKDLCDEHAKKLLLNKLIPEEKKSKIICTQAMRYLVDVNGRMNKSLNEAGCDYLYYWIYERLHNHDKDISVHVNDVHNELLDIFTEKYKIIGNNNICRNLEDPITKIYFPQIIDVYNVYNKIIKYTSSNDNVFKEVVDIMNKHNEKIESLYSEIKKSRIIIPCKSNTIVPIMITFVVAVLISIFIFVLLKFTKYGSLLRHGVLWKRNHWDSLGEENNMFEIPDISSSFSRENEYNISYNYR